MTSVSTDASDTTSVETYGRWPLVYLLGSAVAWLVLSGILALVAGIQVHSPELFSSCPVLSHGRITAIAQTAFVYGWLAQAGLGLALWVLARIGGEPLRAANWAFVGAVFWNAAVFFGIVGIGAGEATSIPYLEMPRAVQPILVLSYGAIAVSGVLSWSGRRRSVMFASHWYAVAAFFLFPWFLSVAQVMLLWFPVRGTLQAVVAGWYGQGVWTLWLAPLALSAAYYVVPRSSGKPLPHYEFAPLGFWCLLFIGSWTGGRHLLGGPVPVWISTVAVVASFTLVFHTVIVTLNLSPALSGGSTPLRFIGIGVAAYALGAAVDAVTSLRAVAAVTQFTYFDRAQTELALTAALSTLIVGAIYFALPRLVGRDWAWSNLIKLHFVLVALGLVLLIGGLAAAGLVEGGDLADTSVTFSKIGADTAPWLTAATGGQALLLFGNVLFLVNVIKTALCPRYAAEAASLRAAAAPAS